MITYAETRIPQEDIILFKKIEKAINSIDVFETPNFEEITCHILAKAIGDLFNLKAVNGFWNVSHEHSWLITENGNILDVYPVGTIGGPILIDWRVCNHQLYEPADNNEKLYGDTSSDNFYNCVVSVKEQIMEEIKQ